MRIPKQGREGLGVNSQLFVKFNDGAGATGATFTKCETIKYQAKVRPSGEPTFNARGDAPTTWPITTPHNEVHDVMPAGGITLLTSGGRCTDSLELSYTIKRSGPQSAATTLAPLLSKGYRTPRRAYTAIKNYSAPCGAGSHSQCADKVCDPSFEFQKGGSTAGAGAPTSPRTGTRRATSTTNSAPPTTAMTPAPACRGPTLCRFENR